MTIVRLTCLILSLGMTFVCPLEFCLPQELNPAETEGVAFPDLSFPEDANEATLEAIVVRAKNAVPKNFQQFQSMHTAIRDASRRLLELMRARQQTSRYKQAELDVITASISLLANAGHEGRKKTIEEVQKFLKAQNPLSMTDVQTGFFAAKMFELQPNKRPARDTYQLLFDLLADDDREEMKQLRINLNASIRRLDLLGKRFELAAQDVTGQPIVIEQFSGKFLLVSFFDTTNELCRREIQAIKAYFEKYRPKGLEVIGIGLDRQLTTIRRFVESNALNWPIIHDNASDPLEQLRLEYGINSLPAAFLLNKEGTVVSLEAHGSELGRLMQILFESPTPAAPLPNAASSTTVAGAANNPPAPASAK